MARPKKSAPEPVQDQSAPEPVQDQSAPEPVQDQSAPEPVQSDLVLMAKDGVTLEVHPTCVKAHKDAGWKVVE